MVSNSAVSAPSWLSRRGSLHEQLVTELIERISSGELSARQPLPTEDELAQMASVGRSTVREAIKTLANMGVVEVRRGRGTFIRDPSAWSPFDPRVLQARGRSPGGKRETTRKLLEARRLVEAGVAELAAQQADDATTERMRSAVERMKAARDDEHVEDFIEADLEFHQALFDAADNPFVSALFQPIENLVRGERRATSEPREARLHAVAAHRKILQAVCRGDASAARRSMQDHLDETIADMEEHWRRA